MVHTPWRAMVLAIWLPITVVLLGTCGNKTGGVLYVHQIIEKAQEYAGREVTIDGAYVWRPGDPDLSVLALGVSTLDSGLDAKPLGEPIWVENFPAEVTADLHRPGDAVYGFVRVTGMFETGGRYGPNGAYSHRLQVSQAQSIERIKRIEHTIKKAPLGPGKVTFFELQSNPPAYHGKKVTTRGYYFWNSMIWVLAEGVATEQDGSSPQPLGTPIWMEGFPPQLSEQLTIGPGNSYVWGLVEVTGTFQTGGGFGHHGSYQHILFVESASVVAE